MRSNDPEPYNSWGNGSAMRVSPIAWVTDDLDWALEEARRSAEVTHDHPQGIAGAQAVVASVLLARTGHSKEFIRAEITRRFGYHLDRTIASIRPSYIFDVSCQGSVPEAIIAFLESENFEEAIRKAISLGGDSDTIASIAGAIAHAFYGGIPEWMTKYCVGVLDPAQRSIMADFWEKFPQKDPRFASSSLVSGE
jgi:ADP-ribosylglycohydrolase